MPAGNEMHLKYLKEEIQRTFSNAEIGRIFFAKKNILLEEQYGHRKGQSQVGDREKQLDRHSGVPDGNHQ